MRTIYKIIPILLLLVCVQSASATWVKHKTTTFTWLRDIAFVSESKGFIVGTDGVMMTTEDGGANWKQLPKFTTDSLLQIKFTDANTGWLLCERNAFSRGQNATSYLRKTVDGGRNWERIEFEDAGRERVTRIAFNKYGWGTAFGERGLFYKLQEDGKTWKQSKTAVKFLLLNASYSGGNNGVISGAGGTIMFSEDNGLLWDRATLLGHTDARFNSIYMVGDKLGWAVGSGGAIVQTTGGGRLWKPLESGTDANLNDVFFLDERKGWAVGDQGTILRTTDGGKTWDEENSQTKHRLERIYFRNGRGWAIGFGGTILSNGLSENPQGEERPTIVPRSE